MSELVLEKNNKLPLNWAETNIGSIGKIIHYGYTAKSTKKDTGTKYLRITDIQNNHVDWGDVPFCKIPQENKSDFLLHENDIVFARTGGTVGKSFLIKNDVPSAVFASYLIRVVLTEHTVPKFIHFFFQSGSYWHQIQKGKTGLKTNVNAQILSKLVFQLPPLNEQKRIVEKIEELFSKLDNAKFTLENIKLQLKQYRQSILNAVVSSNFFGDEVEYEQIPISKVIESIGQGWSPKCENTSSLNDEEWTVMTTTSVQPMKFDSSQNKILPKNLEPRPKLELQENDLLITRAGPRSRVGITCLVKKTKNRLLLCDKAYRIRYDKNSIEPSFFEIVLNTPHVTTKIDEIKTGTSDSGLNLTMGRFSNLIIPLPSKPRQNKIIAFTEEKFSLIQNTENITTSMLFRIDSLKFSILKQAFEGKLVPQDPNDEPAEILLQKIKQEKEQLKQIQKSKKRKKNAR